MNTPTTSIPESQPQKLFSYRKAKDQKPVRNKTAFIHYSIQLRAMLKTTQPNLTSTEIMSLLATRWKALDAKEKASYEKIARADKKRYQKDLVEYQQRVGTNENLKNRTKSNHIKKPMSAYSFFMKDRSAELKASKSGLAQAEILKVISAEWKALDAKAKEEYKKKSEEQKKAIYAMLMDNKDKKEAEIDTPTKKVKEGKLIRKDTQDTSNDLELIRCSSEVLEPSTPTTCATGENSTESVGKKIDVFAVANEANLNDIDFTSLEFPKENKGFQRVISYNPQAAPIKSSSFEVHANANKKENSICVTSQSELGLLNYYQSLNLESDNNYKFDLII